MAQRTDFKANRHVCIFEMERKNRSFTGHVVCTVCGVKLSSANQAPVKGDARQINLPPHRSSGEETAGSYSD